MILSVHAARVETPTVDEFAHVPAGCAYWKYGRLDLYCKNPPLLRFWMALPVVLDRGVNIPEIADPSWDWGPWLYGVRFMNANRPGYFDLFFRARLMIIPLGLATALLLYRWGDEVFGRYPAAIVTSWFLLLPPVLAHAHLATTDVGCMFSVFLSLFVFRWAYQRPGTRRFLVAGAVWGLALLIKFTALLLLPLLVGLAVLYRLRSEGKTGPSRALKAGGDVAVLLFSAWLVINLGMGFKGTLRPLGGYTFSSSFCEKVQTVLPAWLPIPLPEDYVIGFDGQKMDAESGEFGSYLLGQWSQGGRWYYNLVALGVKLPLPFLAAIGAGLWLWLRRPLEVCERWTVLAPAAVLLVALSLLSRLNLGIRYLLPVVPFLFLLTGALWARVGASPRRWLRWTPFAVLAHAGITAAAAHPNYLAYFNLIAGGPAGGQEWLVDSNLDWGQDLYRVREAVRPFAGDGPIRLLYFGHVDPELYGIRYGPVPAEPVQDVIAISMNYLVGNPYVVITPDGKVRHVLRNHTAWLHGYRPVRRVGSMVIFDTREP
ncbi:MAG: glycosyltransferase family 39 protein [Planctomycetota bacterium]